MSALVLVEPAVNESLVATARSKGIPITAGDEHLMTTAAQRAVRFREKIAALEAELDRFKRKFAREN